MKKLFTLLISILFVLVAFGQDFDFTNKKVIKDNESIYLKQMSEKFNQKLQSFNKIKPRATTEDYEFNYGRYYNYQAAGGTPSTYASEFYYQLNSRVDTSNVVFAYSAKRIKQAFPHFPFLVTEDRNFLSYNRDSVQFLMDTLEVETISRRRVKSVTDTFRVSIGYFFDTYIRSWNRDSQITNLHVENRVLTGNDSIGMYTYVPATPIQFPKGSIPIITLEYFSTNDSNTMVVSHYKNTNNCSSQDDLFASRNRFGLSDYVGVIRFSDGAMRISFFGNQPLNIDPPCNYWETQTWGINMKGRLIVEPQVNVLSTQDKFCENDEVTLAANMTGINGPDSLTRYTWSPTTGLDVSNEQVVTAKVGTASRTYTVTAQNGSQTASAQITVFSAALTATMGTAPTLTSCVDTNKSLSVSVSGPTAIGNTQLPRGYTWNTGLSTSATHTKVKEGTYSVTVTNGLCTASASAEVKMSSSAQKINVDFEVDPAEPCQNKVVQFTNNSDDTEKWKFTWLNGTNVFSSVAEPTNYKFTSSGKINVTLEARYGACLVKKTNQITVLASNNTKCKSSISSIDLSEAIKLYPNPVVSGKLSIDNNTNAALDVRVLDLSGKQLVLSHISSSKDLIDVSKLPNGIYFVEINSADGTITHKIEISNAK